MKLFALTLITVNNGFEHHVFSPAALLKAGYVAEVWLDQSGQRITFRRGDDLLTFSFDDPREREEQSGIHWDVHALEMEKRGEYYWDDEALALVDWLLHDRGEAA